MHRSGCKTHTVAALKCERMGNGKQHIQVLARVRSLHLLVCPSPIDFLLDWKLIYSLGPTVLKPFKITCDLHKYVMGLVSSISIG